MKEFRINARERRLRPGLREDADWHSLSPDAARLYILLSVSCDDYGRMIGAPHWVKENLYPSSARPFINEVAGWLAELRITGFVEVYGAYLWLPRFYAEQKILRPTPSKLPAPPGFEDIR